MTFLLTYKEAYNHLNYHKGDFPIADGLSKTCISLPLYPGLKKEQVKYITSVIADFYGK
ncbi:MAG: DegT/DnrJ/EryC1/StrS family aminotransferase [Arcicella sp.]|nr:DegT/DnrJ/EryC1/StrS family aminotransferase [Arcicella sp.]